MYVTDIFHGAPEALITTASHTGAAVVLNKQLAGLTNQV